MYLHESVRLLTQHDIYATANLYQFLNPDDQNNCQFAIRNSQLIINSINKIESLPNFRV